MSSDQDKILVILDLDETLIHATARPENEEWDFDILGYKIYKRPHLKEFLTELKNHFHVAIWSSATEDYVKEVVKKIIPEDYKLHFVWSRNKCTYKPNIALIESEGYFDHFNHYNYIKRIKKVRKKYSFRKERILIIDDSPEKCTLNYGNAIYPKEFTGNKNDDELRLLLKYLLTLKDRANVREIEKRNWREMANNQKELAPQYYSFKNEENN